MDNNPLFSFNPTEYVNDPFVIGQQNKMVAINTALEVDLTGQVCADSLGTRFYSGIGGQADFNQGAGRSPGGRAIIALPSTAEGGKVSRIVPTLKPGAGVVTTRGAVHYVVTEYGIAYLHGKSVQERAMALITIAHPDFREELLSKAVEYKWVRPEMADVEGRLFVGPKEAPHHDAPGRRDAHQLPGDEPDRRAGHSRPLLLALPGDRLLPLHVAHEAHPAEAAAELRLRRPPQRGGHRGDGA